MSVYILYYCLYVKRKSFFASFAVSTRALKMRGKYSWWSQNLHALNGERCNKTLRKGLVVAAFDQCQWATALLPFPLPNNS